MKTEVEKKKAMVGSVGKLLATSSIILASSIGPAMPSTTSLRVAPTLALILATVVAPVAPALYSLAGACGCQCVTK